MAEGSKAPGGFEELSYERLVAELDGVVKKLEAGELSLEESLQAFERGVLLAQAAESRLDAAEQRVELLLHGDRTAPFPAEGGAGLEGSGTPAGAGEDDDDVPF